MYDLLAKTRAPKRIRIEDAGTTTVPYGYKWLIIGGKITHITGMDSVLTVEFEGIEVNKLTVESEYANDYVGLYQHQMVDTLGAAKELLGSSYQMWIVGYGCKLTFNGGTGSRVDLMVIEVPEVRA